MPFKSEAQRKFLFAKKPKIAKRWAKKYGVPKDMPEHVGKGKKSRMMMAIMAKKKMGM